MGEGRGGGGGWRRERRILAKIFALRNGTCFHLDTTFFSNDDAEETLNFINFPSWCKFID